MSSCGALFAACEPAAQTFGNTARKECRHDLRGSWHTVAAGLNLLELLADVRHHLLDMMLSSSTRLSDRIAERISFWFAFANSNT